jgi:bacterioferritin-associated ferredoxin
MITCVCNAICCKTVKDACETADSFPEMLQIIGYKESCGTCFECLKSKWEEIHGTENQEEIDFEEDWYLSGEF